MNKEISGGRGQLASTVSSDIATGPNNGLGRTLRDRDFLYVAEGARAFCGERQGLQWDRARQCLVSAVPPGTDDAGPHGSDPAFARYTSPIIQCRFPAFEFLPSWNIRVASGAGFRIYMRVYDEGEVSPWFFMGEGGAWRKQGDEITKDDAWGGTRIDYLALRRPALSFQYRVEFITTSDQVAAQPAELHRFFVHYSGQAQRNRKTSAAPTERVHVEIPYRSQLDVEQEALKHIVCCPTCVAMVLESRGIDRPTVEICHDAYDERHQIYGIWPRASQAAFQNGLKSWVQRFRHIADVRTSLQNGQPIIASIRVNEGELRGARYPKSNGHLIVITGISEDGKIICNDPYSAGPSGGEIHYEREDIEKVWLDRGGVAIMVETANNQKKAS